MRRGPDGYRVAAEFPTLVSEVGFFFRISPGRDSVSMGPTTHSVQKPVTRTLTHGNPNDRPIRPLVRGDEGTGLAESSQPEPSTWRTCHGGELSSPCETTDVHPEPEQPESPQQHQCPLDTSTEDQTTTSYIRDSQDPEMERRHRVDRFGLTSSVDAQMASDLIGRSSAPVVNTPQRSYQSVFGSSYPEIPPSAPISGTSSCPAMPVSHEQNFWPRQPVTYGYRAHGRPERFQEEPYSAKWGRSYNGRQPSVFSDNNPGDGLECSQSRSHSTASGDRQEPKVSLPLFNGKGEWKTFWLQFERLGHKLQWTDEECLDRLVTCLRDDALEHYASQPVGVRDNLQATICSFECRFTDRGLPETYRATPQFLKKRAKESLEEFAARVRTVQRTSPSIVEIQLREDLMMEHLVEGLSGQNLVKDVLTKKPGTVEDAPDLIQRHESCKAAQFLRAGIRQACWEDDDEDEDVPVQRFSTTMPVTEERLNQFGREIKDDILKTIREESLLNHRPRRDNRWKRRAECYICHQIGHIARDCQKYEQTCTEATMAAESEPGSRGNNRPRRGSSWKGTSGCYICHYIGHIARDCPKNEQTHTQATVAVESVLLN